MDSAALREDMSVVLDLVSRFDGCRMITIPLGAFEGDPADTAGYNRDHYRQFRDTIGDLTEMVAATGGRLALEIIPGSIIGGIDGYMHLCNDLGPDAPGLNFDTGHARAAGEDVLQIPERIGKQILGTHLCDNLGHPNLSLRPGKGSIDWPRMIGALIATGYGGAWDIEIICPPERCREEYGQAHNFITSQLQQATARLPVR
jgi:sugar phosphate isomerase/epimerase